MLWKMAATMRGGARFPSKIISTHFRTKTPFIHQNCNYSRLYKNCSTSRRVLFSSSRSISTGRPLHLADDRENGSKLEESTEDVASKYYVPRKFIPMTRKALVRRILEDNDLVTLEERGKFQDFSLALDNKIATTFHGVLGELKALYDPLNPDKETQKVKAYSNVEQEESEFWLLEKLSSLLEKAYFYELPASAIHDALKEHDTSYGVLVSVDPTKYDVLRMWVIGKELEPNDFGPWYMTLYTKTYNWALSIPKIERYKRVIAAIRHKKQQKLLLKGFKDIRCVNLEHLLPEGKIRMTQFDQRILVGMLGIGVASIVIKLVSFLADYKISWIYIATAVTGVVALRAWTMYKNKRNTYLVDLSRTLYFKSIANNRALLTLVVDRAEDEVFKATLLAYSFLQASSRIATSGDAITSGELEDLVNKWMNTNSQVETKFDSQEPLRQLEMLGLLEKEKIDDEYFLKVVPLCEALAKLPTPPLPGEQYKDRMEELEIDTTPGAADEDDQQRPEIKQDELQEKRIGWH